MPHIKPLTSWRLAAALATEGACLLPYLLTTLLTLAIQSRPPYLLPYIPLFLQAALPIAALTLLYGGLRAPLCLWRTAYYVRACDADDSPISLVATRRGWCAVRWRWLLWRRRVLAVALACAPSAALFGGGALASQQTDSAAVQPLLWLVAGVLALLIGLAAAFVWQCRYVLAPLFILRGESASVAMAFSARAMRGRIGSYINFLGAQLPCLLPCLLLLPALRQVPVFRHRHTALLLSFMPPDE